MKTELSLFKNTGNARKTAAPGKTHTSKAAVRKQISNTRLTPSSLSTRLIEWKPADDRLTISWKVAAAVPGEILVAATEKGVCFIGFVKNDTEAVIADLKTRFPANPFEEKESIWHERALETVNKPGYLFPVNLHLKGTSFQLHIWEQLLTIPFGGLTTYGNLTAGTKGARAAGNAVGANPVSIIVPCHRVVRADGSYEGYYWGNELKQRLLAWEAAESSFTIANKHNQQADIKIKPWKRNRN